VTPLGDSVRRMLADENLKSRIDSDVSLEETFQALVTHALSTLVSGVEARTEVGTGVAKTDWSKVESTGDSSAYVTHAQATFATAVPPVRQTVRDDYFLFFCEKLAGSIAPGAYAAVFRCKKFSDHGAQQLLLDVHALKTLLCELPKAGALGKDEKPRVVPTSYARMVGREMQKVESLVKVILSPREGLAETFRALLPTGSGAEFKKVCELNGMAKKEAEATAVRAFGAAALAQPKATAKPVVSPAAAAAAAATGQPASSHYGHASSSAQQHRRTGSGGGGTAGGGLGGMNSSMFKGMNASMFKMGGVGMSSSVSGMMDRAKDFSAKAASGMKEAADKAKEAASRAR